MLDGSLTREAPDAAAGAYSVVEQAIARLDAWFDTMHLPGGYGGPVVHWWQQSLVYTGPGLDWRYEGILTGYIHLWERTGEARWLTKAIRAGDDLCNGQDPEGHFRASTFEINPATAGTPHEPGIDTALLLLARTLRAADHPDWEKYARSASHNLRAFLLGKLWDPETRSFWDTSRSSGLASFVPNKASMICEALFMQSELTGEAEWVERYALPTLERVMAHQVQGQGRLDGAIAQNSLGNRRVNKYFPIYIARCIPALIRANRWTGQERYLNSAVRAMNFISGWMNPDGSFPTVVYPDGSTNRYPSWIAPLGDVLRAAVELRPFGVMPNIDPALTRLLAGQDETGGIQTARGFAVQGGGKLPELPDVRDVLHVAGWCDKAFRFLCACAGPVIPPATSGTLEVDCTFRGRAMHLIETPTLLEIQSQGQVCYRWRKAAPQVDVASAEFWLR